MISIITCYATPHHLDNLSASIRNTIGVPYELIAIDNIGARYGICKAYNEGIARSRYPFICFVHEDVIFETKNWGVLLCRHLSKTEVGLIGVAGGDSKSMIPSSWSIPVFSNEINIIQHYKYQKKNSERVFQTRSKNAIDENEVVVLDGVFLATRRSLLDQYRFDEKNFPGFHGYDIDFSLQIGQAYHLKVVFDIVLHHFSDGNPDKSWMESAIVLSRKWKHHLPVSLYRDNKQLMKLQHWKTMQVFLEKSKELEYSGIPIAKLMLHYSFNRFFSIRRFLSLLIYYIHLFA